MNWWKKIIESINESDVLYTPGRGLDGGNLKKPFIIHSIEPLKILILSGKYIIGLEKMCFDIVENAFTNDHNLWLRCASVHGNEALAQSVDKLIRERSSSQLARGNYVCSILNKSGLVKYSINNNKKCIELC